MVKGVTMASVQIEECERKNGQISYCVRVKVTKGRKIVGRSQKHLKLIRCGNSARPDLYGGGSVMGRSTMTNLF